MFGAEVTQCCFNIDPREAIVAAHQSLKGYKTIWSGSLVRKIFLKWKTFKTGDFPGAKSSQPQTSSDKLVKTQDLLLSIYRPQFVKY